MDGLTMIGFQFHVRQNEIHKKERSYLAREQRLEVLEVLSESPEVFTLVSGVYTSGGLL